MLKVTSETSIDNRKELEAEVDADIAAFEQDFTATTGDRKLHGSEKAILKTYLAFKLGIVAKK